MMKAWQCYRHGTWLALLLSGCSAISRLRGESQDDDKKQEKDTESTTSAIPSSGHDHAPLGFVLESTLRARRIHNGRPIMFLELSNGATVIDGDRLQVSIRTSQDAYLYLAFCSQHAKDPRYFGLKVFPESAALRVRAYETTIAPDRAAEIVLDDKPGQEALYLILSQVELASSDSELAQVLASARQGSQSADCGSPFRAAGAGSRNERKVNKVWSGNPQSRGRRPALPTRSSRTPKRADTPPEEDPVVEIQRGGDIVWNNGASMGVEADPDGIVILRYGLTHVAAQ